LSRAWSWARRNEYLLIVSCLITAVFLNWHMVGPVLPRFALDFGVSVAEVSLLISAFTLARILLNFPGGALTERIGRRPVLLVGGIVVAIASIGSGLVNDFGPLVLLRFLTGAGGALAVTTQVTIMADISTPRTRARLMSYSEGIVSFGLFLGPGIGGYLGDAVGLRIPFFVAAALTLAATTWAALRLPETRGWNAEPGRESATNGMAAARKPGVLEGVSTVLADRNYLMITMVGVFVFFTRFASFFFMLPILAYGLGMTPGEYGLVASGIALLQLPMLALIGPLSDRFGRKALLVPTTMLTGLAVVGFGLAPSKPIFALVAAAYALASGISGPSGSTYLGDVAPPSFRGIAVGLYRTAGDVAGFIGPPMLGALAVAWSQGAAVVANGIGLCLVGVVFQVFARETMARPWLGEEPDSPRRTVASNPQTVESHPEQLG
jgi:MFS transporter, DHA1 family, multidrug resistance protein